MPLKKYKKSSKTRSSRSSSKTMKRFRRKTKSKTRSRSRKNKSSRKTHRGGFSSSCNLATVKEPGFKLDAIGAIPGLSIPESSAVIYRPNCKTNSYQAMVS